MMTEGEWIAPVYARLSRKDVEMTFSQFDQLMKSKCSICRHCGEPFSAHDVRAAGVITCPPDYCAGAHKVTHFEPLESIPSVTAGTSKKLIKETNPGGSGSVTVKQLFDAFDAKQDRDNPICKNCGQRKSVHHKESTDLARGEEMSLFCFHRRMETKDYMQTFVPLPPLPKAQEGICRNCGKKEDEHHRSSPTVLHCTPYEDKSNCRTFESLRSEDDGFPPNDSPDRRHTIPDSAKPSTKIQVMEAHIREVWSRRHDQHLQSNANDPKCPFCQLVNGIEINTEPIKHVINPMTREPEAADHHFDRVQGLEKENGQLQADVADLENEIKNLRGLNQVLTAESNLRKADNEGQARLISVLNDSNGILRKIASIEGEHIYRDGRRSMDKWVLMSFGFGIAIGLGVFLIVFAPMLKL